MSHLYFDLTMDDEHFPDPVGETITDLTAAHARAVLLVRRVMMFSESDAETPRAKRGVVTIKDDTGRVLTIRHCSVRRTRSFTIGPT